MCNSPGCGGKRAGKNSLRNSPQGASSPWARAPLEQPVVAHGVAVEYIGVRAGASTYVANGRTYRAGRNSQTRILRNVPIDDANVLITRYRGDFEIVRPDGEEPLPESTDPVIVSQERILQARASGGVVVTGHDDPSVRRIAAVSDADSVNVPVEVSADGAETPVVQSTPSDIAWAEIEGLTPRQVKLLVKTIPTSDKLAEAGVQGIALVLNVDAGTANGVYNAALIKLEA